MVVHVAEIGSQHATEGQGVGVHERTADIAVPEQATIGGMSVQAPVGGVQQTIQLHVELAQACPSTRFPGAAQKPSGPITTHWPVSGAQQEATGQGFGEQPTRWLLGEVKPAGQCEAWSSHWHVPLAASQQVRAGQPVPASQVVPGPTNLPLHLYEGVTSQDASPQHAPGCGHVLGLHVPPERQLFGVWRVTKGQYNLGTAVQAPFGAQHAPIGGQGLAMHVPPAIHEPVQGEAYAARHPPESQHTPGAGQELGAHELSPATESAGHSLMGRTMQELSEGSQHAAGAVVKTETASSLVTGTNDPPPVHGPHRPRLYMIESAMEPVAFSTLNTSKRGAKLETV